MQINRSKKRIQIIIAFLFIWISISVYVAYYNLNNLNAENEKLENAINQFKSLESIHVDISDMNQSVKNLIESDNKKTRNAHQNHINQLISDTAKYGNTIQDKNIELDFAVLKSKINKLISFDFSENEKMISWSEASITLNEIDRYLNTLKKKQLAIINEAEKLQIKNSKLSNYQILGFRILFFVIFIVLMLLLKNNLNLFEKKARNAIEEKNAQLKEIIDGFIDPFFSLDNDWNVAYINDSAASHYSLAKDKLIGKNYWDVTPHLREHQFYKELTSAKQNGKAKVVELFYPPTNQWYENWIYPNNYGVSVYYREITEKKKEIERAIQEKKEQEIISERLVLISNAANEALWDWNLETNEVWGNDKYYELMNKKNPHESNYEAWIKNIHPDDLKVGMQEYENAMHQGLEKLANEYRFLNKNNQWIHLLNRQTYIYDKKGKAIRVLGTIQDITFQKKILEQIKYEKDLSDVLINSLPGLFYMFNKDQKFIRWNKNLELFSGYSSEEMPSVHPTEFVPEDQRERVAQKIANVFLNGSDFVEADFYTKDKNKVPYYFTGVYIKYNNEDCMMGVGLDLSEKVKIENELRELSSRIQNIREEERTNIAREIHDELGQQLTGLKMDLSLIHKKLDANDEVVNEKITDALKIVDHTIQSVRRIATELRPSILDDLGLIAALEWQCEDFQSRFNITSTFFSNVAFVEIDKEKATTLFRIYQESLTNILKHSGATKTTTTLNLNQGKLKLQISDNGVGFDLDKIKSKTTLGLLGMRERAKMINGKYSISSNNVDGTTIIVIVPLDT